MRGRRLNTRHAAQVRREALPTCPLAKAMRARPKPEHAAPSAGQRKALPTSALAKTCTRGQRLNAQRAVQGRRKAPPTSSQSKASIRTNAQRAGQGQREAPPSQSTGQASAAKARHAARSEEKRKAFPTTALVKSCTRGRRLNAQRAAQGNAGHCQRLHWRKSGKCGQGPDAQRPAKERRKALPTRPLARVRYARPKAGHAARSAGQRQALPTCALAKPCTRGQRLDAQCAAQGRSEGPPASLLAKASTSTNAQRGGDERRRQQVHWRQPGMRGRKPGTQHAA